MIRTLIALSLATSIGGAFAQAPQRTARPGDVAVYAVLQKGDRTVAFDETVTITAVEGDRIKTSHTRSDRPERGEGLYGVDWATHKSGANGMQMDPPSRVLSKPLEAGKSWNTSYTATTATGAKLGMKVDSKVAGQEKLKTPAGEFDTWRVESSGYLSGLSFQGGWAFQQKVWYAPALDRIVRTEYKEQRSLGAESVSELKSFKPAD